jgi:hypothetical protein
MKPRQNQPVKSPRGRFCAPQAERLATTFGQGKRTTRFPMSLPPGVLVRLLARQNQIARAKIKGLISPGHFSMPLPDTKFRSSSFGLNN